MASTAPHYKSHTQITKCFLCGDPLMLFGTIVILWLAVVICMFNYTDWSSMLLRMSRMVGDGTIRNNRTEHTNTITHGKFYFVFSYAEQLSMATRNLLTLAALGSYSGHQVVLPFVKNSRFFGSSKMSSDTQTLELYYNLSALNIKASFTRIQHFGELGKISECLSEQVELTAIYKLW